MSRLAAHRVVVVGAGAGGAAAALCCARAGARVVLFERVAEPKAVGAGILLQPNGLGVLYGLGMESALAAHGCRTREAAVVDAGGRTLSQMTLPDFGDGLDHALCIRRSRLLEAMLDAVAAQPGITTRFGVEVTAATRDGRVTWRDGSGATGETCADLVVVADGVHSQVREAGGFGARRTLGHWNLRVIAPVPSEARFVERWTPLGICGEGPVDGGTYLYATVVAPAVREALDARDLRALQRAYATACPPAARVLDAVERFDDLLVNQVIRIDCARWVDGRVVLLGDAAHGMAPNLGQGANSALVDAATLASMLAADGLGDDVLERWQRRRQRPVRTVQDVAAALARVSNLRPPLVRALRDGLVRLASLVDDGARGVRRVQQEDPAWLRSAVGALAA